MSVNYYVYIGPILEILDHYTEVESTKLVCSNCLKEINTPFCMNDGEKAIERLRLKKKNLYASEVISAIDGCDYFNNFGEESYCIGLNENEKYYRLLVDDNEFESIPEQVDIKFFEPIEEYLKSINAKYQIKFGALGYYD